MPTISQARIASFTGKITFESEPPAAISPSTAPDAAAATVASGLSSVTGPTGPTGPAGTAGPPISVTSNTVVLTVGGTIGASASAILTTTTHNLLCVQVSATTAGSPQNYVLGLYDGDPTMSGVLVYQATGITGTSYTDNAPFFITVASGHIWGQITNIDADATVLTLTIQYLALS
jgi:hypothetical protein